MKVLQARKDKGLDAPALDRRPELDHADLLFWQAFNDLDAGRQAGFSPCPVPLSEIVGWLDLHLIRDKELRIEVVEVVRHLDGVWLAHASETRRMELDRTKKAAARKGRKR